MEKSPMKKKKWFTPAEKTFLRQLVRLNSSVINTGRRKGVSVQAKKKAWQNITDIYNDHPSTVTHRTVIELRRCWDCMKFYAKKSEHVSEFGGKGDATNCIIASSSSELGGKGDASNCIIASSSSEFGGKGDATNCIIASSSSEFGNERDATNCIIASSSTESITACHPSNTPLQHLALHPHLLATILAKGESESSAMQKSVAPSDQDAVHDNEQQPQQTLLDLASATDNSPTKDKSSIDAPLAPSTTSPSAKPPISTNNPSINDSQMVSLVLSSLRCEQLKLRRHILAGEALLLQQCRRHALHEHQQRLARDREEHQARLDALRQDFALKKIMFRVQVCQMQSDASVR